jgi:hypothetical protein
MDRKKEGMMMVKVFNPAIQSWQGAWSVPSAISFGRNGQSIGAAAVN